MQIHRIGTHGVILALTVLGLSACDETPLVQEDSGRDTVVHDAPDDADLPDVFAEKPFVEFGEIVAPNMIDCVTDDGVTTRNCNHHGSSVWVTKDQTVVAVWYQGAGEKSLDSRILWAKRPAGQDWTDWKVLYDLTDHAEGNPVFWVNDVTGDWHLFYVTLFGPTWNDGQIRMITSTDEGKTWSAPMVLREEHKWMTRNKPIRMTNGEILLPTYDERLYTPTFMISDNDFTTTPLEIDMGEYLFFHINEIQPSVIERRDGTIVAIMRNTNEDVDHYAWKITSTDFGRTWSLPETTPIPNNGHSNEMIKLADGRWAITFNNNLMDRYPVSIALSGDEGQTWDIVANVRDDCPDTSCSYGYPSIAQDPVDQSLWVTYTHNRETVGWVHVNEAWLKINHVGFVAPEVEQMQ